MNSGKEVIDIIKPQKQLFLFGYREYLWSEENVALTGSEDGYKPPTCTQEASFNFSGGIVNPYISAIDCFISPYGRLLNIE